MPIRVGHPDHLNELEAVIRAYNDQINRASSYLNAGLSLLIGSERLLVTHLAAEIGARSGRQFSILKHPNIDRAREPNPGRIAAGHPQEIMAALQETLTATPIEGIVIMPHFGTLASADEGAVNAHAHELAQLLYEHNDRIILAFTDLSVRLPQVIAERFATRMAIDILPRTVLASDGSTVPIGQALITKAEAALFEGFDAVALYPHIAGINAVRLRHGMRFAYNECTADGPNRRKFYELLLKLLVFKVTTSNGFEISNVSLGTIGGYHTVKAEIAQALMVLSDARHGALPEYLSRDLVPKGFLFHGPPGTGKTLFARAIALPDEQDRREIASIHAAHFGVGLTSGLLDRIAAATEGMNGDEIRSIFRDARAEELVGGHPANARQLGELIGVLQRLRSSSHDALDIQTTKHSKGAAGIPIMGQGKVFISYVREDSAMVDRIAETLRTHGIDAWLDRTHIAPGERWQQVIRNVIREGHCFLACFSPSYAQRDNTYMNEELRIAVEQLRLMPLSRRWFIPVMLKTCQIPDFPIDATDTLGSFQYIDFSHDWDSAMAQLINAVA
jgi:hypothetical protein